MPQPLKNEVPQRIQTSKKIEGKLKIVQPDELVNPYRKDIEIVTRDGDCNHNNTDNEYFCRQDVMSEERQRAWDSPIVIERADGTYEIIGGSEENRYKRRKQYNIQ